MFSIRYEKGGGTIIKKLVQNLQNIDGKILAAIGMGMLISAILMNMSYSKKFQRDVEVEARKLGMVYPSEIKTIEVKPWKDDIYDSKYQYSQ